MTPARSARPTGPATPAWLPGIAVAGLAALVALAVSSALPAVPLLTAAVALGIAAAQIPRVRAWLAGAPKAGLALAARRLMRIGVVLLGLKLSLVDVAALGWRAVLLVVAVVLLAFAGTYLLARLFRMPGSQPLLLAAGFSICGVSAIGAMSAATRSRGSDAAVPAALVTLCGTLAIAVLPLLAGPLGLSAEEFGHWVGAGVHDVGQVVATAQVAGSAALTVAIAIKLTRVLMLAPLVAGAAAVTRRRERIRRRADEASASTVASPAAAAPTGDPAGAAATTALTATTTTSLPPIVPLFVAGFVAAILARTLLDIPEPVLAAADAMQTALLAMALFALGAAVRLRDLFGTGGRAIAVGLLSWLLIAALALAAVRLG
ncbi:putative sulfate exporter family transporter [Planctomonas deserti]|uniref:YeiH family protein n=1 Tax=Planctomonas deserti TaxID=2144185 RepID=UPI00197BD0AC